MTYDPTKPVLIDLGLQKLGSQWDGGERRIQKEAIRNNGKFLEVKLPTYESNDETIRMNGYYPSTI